MRFRLTIILLFLSIEIFAQQLYLPLGKDYLIPFDHSLNQLSENFHTSFKPYLQSKISNYDSLTDYSHRYSAFIDKRKHNWIWRDLFREKLINIRSDDFRMDINPLANVIIGKDLFDTAGGLLYNNTRGVHVEGSIGDKFSFYSDFYENQSVFLPYITNFVQQSSVVPGEGLVKQFKTNGFDYAMASGYVSYTPDKHFNFQFGHGKNFIGDGYRSLLLSDAAFNYPFLRITSSFWKIQYTNLFASFMDIREPHTYEAGFRKKLGSFHYLSWIVNKRLQIGLFEGVIWQATDSSGNRGFDINYLNPIIFYRPIEFSLGSPNNSLVGANAKVKVFDKMHLYGQLMVDDINVSEFKNGSGFFQNKNGFQLGLKWFDLGLKNLNLQVEYNQVRPYTYAHKTRLQNYSHYNQSLAHPLGANFREALGFVQYRYKNVFIELKFSYALYGADTGSSHWGKDIFQSDFDSQNGYLSFGNSIGQGVKTILTYQDIRIAYLINPATNLNLVAGISNRGQTSIIETQKNNYFYFGITTNLTNRYYDF